VLIGYTEHPDRQASSGQDMSRLPASVRRRSGPSKPSGEIIQIPTTEGTLSESLGPFVVLPTSVNGLSAILSGVGDDVTEADGEHDDGGNPKRV